MSIEALGSNGVREIKRVIANLLIERMIERAKGVVASKQNDTMLSGGINIPSTRPISKTINLPPTTITQLPTRALAPASRSSRQSQLGSHSPRALSRWRPRSVQPWLASL